MMTLFKQIGRWWKRKTWHWPLRWQLMATYLPLILVPLLLTGVVARNVTERSLTLLVTDSARQRAQDLAKRYATYYKANGSWAGVSDVMHVKPPLPDWLALLIALRSQGEGSASPIAGSQYQTNQYASPPPSSNGPTWVIDRFAHAFAPEQILITDTKGIVVATDGNTGLGEQISSDVLNQGTPIVVNGTSVGTLVIGAALGLLNEQQRNLLNAINGTLLVSGALTAALAAALGFWLSGQITHPARQLMIGVQRLARGEWKDPLTVRSHNEFGDLTHAFNQMASEVTRQERLRRQMMADVAHDLRTPLSAMQLEVEALEAGMQTPDAAAVSLREEIEWLQRLVEDLRLLSLMDADQIHLQLAPTPLYDFLDGVCDFWQPMTTESERTLQLDAAPTLPCIPLDAGRMRQVLGNLLDNAIRHTRPGGHIVLRGQVDPAMPSQITIEVSDDGDGITPQDLPYVFDRFYRANRARTKASDRSGNSGLGLSIAQRLVELHNGTITVESMLGQGTTFRVRLPHAVSVAPVLTGRGRPASLHRRSNKGNYTASSTPSNLSSS